MVHNIKTFFKFSSWISPARDMDLGVCGQNEGDRTRRRLQLESEEQRQLKELALASSLQTDDSRGHFKVTICRSLRAVVGQGMRGRPCCRSAELQAAV